MRVGYASAVTHEQPPVPEEKPHQRFARILREARNQRGWTQEQLAVAAGVSTPTVQRYEYGKTTTPDPDSARRIFRALDLDPRIIPVVLGYITAEEMGLPPDFMRQFDPRIAAVIAALEDSTVPDYLKDQWVDYLNFLVAHDRVARPEVTQGHGKAS